MLSVCNVGDCEKGLDTNQKRAKEVKMNRVCGGIKNGTKEEIKNDGMMRSHRVVYVLAEVQKTR